MSKWFGHQWGESDRFAISVELFDDPHPPHGIDDTTSRTWGALELWAGGRCLTRNRRTSGSTEDGVTWYLLPVLRWIARHAEALVNEEPFPDLPAYEAIDSAATWFEESDEPLIQLREAEEDEWFERRSDWWARHAVRAAFEGAASPNIFLRRLGPDVEISWNNELRPPTRSDLEFVEPVGTAYVRATDVADVLKKTFEAVSQAVRERMGEATTIASLGEIAVTDDAWRLLIPRGCRAALESNARLAQVMASRRANNALVVPHTLETLLLRGAPPSQPALETLLSVGRAAEKTPTNASELMRERDPAPAPARQPWEAGYDAALRLREHLGWNGRPAPSLDDWLSERGVSLAKQQTDSSVDGAAVYVDGHSPVLHVNPKGRGAIRWSHRMLLATQLGHVLLDEESDGIVATADTTWTHWPTAARARAFAAMLLMPEDGVREAIESEGGMTLQTVRAIMRQYDTGIQATTWHLKNLRFVSDEARVELLEQAAAQGTSG